MSTSGIPVYFILGTPGSGRRAIVRDLIENGLPADSLALVLLAGSEEHDPADARLAGLKNVEVRLWQWMPPSLPSMTLPAGATVFLLADSRVSPIDQIEALKPWLEETGGELARIFCVVDCRLAERHASLLKWYDACIHFADVVFLGRREGVANKWLSDFLRHFKEECIPSHFIQVKKGDIPNPALVLDPTPRRVSQHFDEGEAYEVEGLETDDEEDEEEDTGLIPPESYFVRQRSGRRERELPDINKYLAKPA